MKSSLVLAAVAVLILSSCKDEPSSPGSIKNGKGKFPAEFAVLPSLSDDHYGIFYASSGSGQVNTFHYEDADFHRDFEVPLTSYSAAYFGNSEAILGASINGSSYEPSVNGSRTHYVHFEPNVYYDGSANSFNWSIGPASYNETVEAPIGTVSLLAPSHMETITKSSGLDVSWPTSIYSDDYVLITLQEAPPVESGDHSQSIAHFQEYVDDLGNFTIPASVLSTFTSSKARLTISRGVAKEATHGGKSYLFVVYNTQGIDIQLQ